MLKRFVHDRLNELMDRHGWIVTGTLGAMYTVGLMDLCGHPEIAVAGLNPRQSHLTLSSAKRLIDAGRVLQGGPISGIIPDYDVMFVRVDDSNMWDWFGQASDYHAHAGQAARMVQLVWPDAMGRFPQDPDYDRERYPQKLFDRRQPDYARSGA